MGGWGVPTEYLVAPVLNWTGLGCDNIFYVEHHFTRFGEFVVGGVGGCSY